MYVFNGFFMSMRSKFVSEGVSIYYYTVEWDSDKLGWEDFRGQVLGPTDPETAPTTSLRGKIFADWENLGTVRVFRHDFALEDAIGSHACPITFLLGVNYLSPFPP
jgi:hypothetical protein